MLTRTQFIVQMIVALARKYPDEKTERLMSMAAQMYREFIEGDKIEYGDHRYDWTESGAHALVADMDAY